MVCIVIFGQDLPLEFVDYPVPTARRYGLMISCTAFLPSLCPTAVPLSCVLSPPIPCTNNHLKLHGVRLVAVPQAEAGVEVAQEVWCLLNVGQKRLVNSLLVFCPCAGNLLRLFVFVSRRNNWTCIPHGTYLWLLALLEECLLTLASTSCLVLGKVTFLGNLVDNLGVNAGQVDLLARGNDIASVHSPQRNTIGLERAGNEKDTLVKGLEEDDTLAAEATSKENEDGAGLKRWAELGRVNGLANLSRKTFVSSMILICQLKQTSATQIC